MSVIDDIESGQAVAYVYDNVQGMPQNPRKTAELLRLAKIGQRVIDLKNFSEEHDSFKELIEICDIFIEPPLPGTEGEKCEKNKG